MSTLFESTQRLGTFPDPQYRHKGMKGFIVLEVTLRVQPGNWQTVTHDTITDPVELSIVGNYFERYDRHDNPSRFGQIADALDEITEPAAGWTFDEVREVRILWERWHLNTMKAACAHMPVDARARWDRRERVECSEGSGYTYGSAWLTEPLPDDVIERVKHLFRDRTHDLYLARGYDAAGNAYPPKEGK